MQGHTHIHTHIHTPLYVPSQLYIAFCLDLTLRVFSEHFELIETVHITATVLRCVHSGCSIRHTVSTGESDVASLVPSPTPTVLQATKSWAWDWVRGYDVAAVVLVQFDLQ